MGSDSKLFLRVDEARAPQILAAVEAAKLSAERRGEWLSLEPADVDLARDLSRETGVAAVHWDIHTVVDQIWLRCFAGGELVRELRYSADEGWAQKSGRPQAFENQRAMKRWLSKRRLLATPDGYDLLESFLGLDTPARTPTVEPIVEPGANTKFQLAPALVDELRRSATRRRVEASWLLQAAWELGKVPLYEREAARAAPLQLVSLRPAQPPPGLGAAPRELPALSLAGYPLSCGFRLPADVTSEILAMKSAFGRTGAWILTEAYVLAREQVA